MSGLEVVGVIASILQLADLGAKLSVKLCSFYRTVRVANQSLEGLSSDVSLTCSILNEFGKTLEQDDQARLCSKQAFCTAQEVLVECKAVFQQIETAIEKYDLDTERNPLRRRAQKITAAFQRPNLDVLKNNLERLKTTTLLMLHVIMYAGELRKRDENSSLLNQRRLIETLIEERRANDHKIKYLSTFPISMRSCQEGSSDYHFTRYEEVEQQQAYLPRQLKEYYNLIRKLLCVVDTYENSLEQSRHLRIRNGILSVHSTEADTFLGTCGHIARQLFDDPYFKFSHVCMPPVGSLSPASTFRDPEIPEVGNENFPCAEKVEKEDKDAISRERRWSPSRSRSRPGSEMYPDPSRDSAGLIEYGSNRVTGSIPAEHYYGQPASPGAYYSEDDFIAYGARRHDRSRSRSRGVYPSSISSGSDQDDRRRRKGRHRSRSCELASATLGAIGLGYAGHRFNQRRDRMKSEKDSRSRSRSRSLTRELVTNAPGNRTPLLTSIGYDDTYRDPYEEAYNHGSYPPLPGVQSPPSENYYPNSNYFPPLASSTPNLSAPPRPHRQEAAGPGLETYVPRPRSADENVCHERRSSSTRTRSCSPIEMNPVFGDGIHGWPKGPSYLPVCGRSPSHSASSIDLGVTLTLNATDDKISQPSFFGEIVGGAATVETLILQWTNVTREEILEESNDGFGRLYKD